LQEEERTPTTSIRSIADARAQQHPALNELNVYIGSLFLVMAPHNDPDFRRNMINLELCFDYIPKDHFKGIEA
jgi:hypothetical protein